MKKSDYKEFLDPDKFAELYDQWDIAGKPTGNNALYVAIWDGVTNAVKACIGALQARYHCQYQDYEDKVLEGTITMVSKLRKLEGTPKNIVTMSYLPMLGICCGKKALQQEFENDMLSTSISTQGGDEFTELMYIDEDGTIQVGNY